MPKPVLVLDPKTKEPIRTRRGAKKYAPAWAKKIVVTPRGFIAFASERDYLDWRGDA